MAQEECKIGILLIQSLQIYSLSLQILGFKGQEELALKIIVSNHFVLYTIKQIKKSLSLKVADFSDISLREKSNYIMKQYVHYDPVCGKWTYICIEKKDLYFCVCTYICMCLVLFLAYFFPEKKYYY